MKNNRIDLIKDSLDSLIHIEKVRFKLDKIIGKKEIIQEIELEN